MSTKSRYSSLLVSHSQSMKSVQQRLAQCSENKNPVLIVGPCGVGKSLVARELHRLTRAQQPLETLVAGDWPSDAKNARVGEESQLQEDKWRPSDKDLFVGVRRGTLVLEWLDRLSETQQGTILSVLEKSSVQLSGQREGEAFQGRIVATMVRCPFSNKTRIRPELLARFAGNVISIPPISSRQEDFEEVVNRLLLEMGYYHKLSSDILDCLAAQPWPFQWHGLRGFLHMLTSQREQRICINDCYELLESSSVYTATRRVSDRRMENEGHGAEKKRVLQAVELHQGNISRAATELGLSRTSLRRKIVSLGIASIVPANRSGRPSGGRR